MGTGKRGRPAGLLLNGPAVEHLLNLLDQPKLWLAGQARITGPVLSQLIAGQRGAPQAMAERIAATLGCEPAVIFPELANFTTAVRYFTVNGAES